MDDAGPLILHVDDDDANRYAVSRSLRHANFRVEEAVTGEEALEKVKLRPDLVILDVRLPGIDGFEVCRRLKADPGTADIPVLHLSASHVSSQAKAHGLDGGADAYLVRPVEPIELIATVQALLRARRSEQALRASEERLRRVIDGVRDYAIFTLDGGGTISSWNSGAERVIGFAEAQAVGRPFEIIFTPEDRAAGVPAAELARAAKDGRAPDVRWHQRANGERFFVDGVVTALFDAGGRPAGYSKLMHDVTERKRLDEERERVTAELDRRQALFDAVLSSVDDFVYVFDRDARFTYVNRRLLDLWGLEPEGVRGKTMLDLGYPPDVETVLLANLREVLDTGRVASSYTRYMSPRGQSAHYENVLSPMRSADGRIDCVVGTSRDVTRRREAEDALRSSEARFRAVVEAVPGHLWTATADGAVDFASPWMPAFCGVPAEALYGERWEAVVHPDDLAATRSAWAHSVASGEAYHVDFRIRARDGSFRWFQTSAVPSKAGEAEGGRVLKWHGYTSDVDDERRASEALRANERRLGLAQRAGRTGVFEWQMLEDRVVWSEELEALYGLPAGAFEGRFDGWRQRVEPADAQRVEQAIAAALAARRSEFEDEFRILRPDGSTRWIGVQAQIRYGADGRPLAMVGVNVDIDERKRVEADRERLLAAERAARAEAERAGRIKDEFLATLSHELRTPLSAILGWATVLRSKPDTPDAQRGMEAIERNARAQARIVDDLLEMNRIIVGKVRLEVQRVDLSQVVREAVDTVRPAAEAKSLRLQTALDSHAGLVSGDPGRLQQVFWNLLSNSIKFTPRGGHIQVLVERVNSHLEVNVVDSGEGIAPEFLPHLFDRFSQADASRTRRHGGLGLGLAIVKQLVELHGGSVRAKSGGTGQGATFSVLLPMLALQADETAAPERRRHPRASLSPAPPALPAGIDLAGLRVLVVDDEEDARELVARLVQDRGASVATAASAGEALERLQAGGFDLLVSDIGMPVEDGYSLIRKVRALGPARGGDVPALALTAYARAEDRIQAVSAGFQMHVAKPVEPAELLTMLASLSRLAMRPAAERKPAVPGDA